MDHRSYYQSKVDRFKDLGNQVLILVFIVDMYLTVLFNIVNRKNKFYQQTKNLAL